MTNALFRRFRPTQIRELITVLIIIGIVLFFATQIDNYLSARTFNRISNDFPIIAVVAVGQLLVVLTRNLDLSVGSQVAVVAWSTGRLMTEMPDLNPLLLVAIAMGMGVAMGSINGFIVAYGRVPAIITTLATLAIFRSFLITVAEAQTVTTRYLPDWIKSFPSTTVVEIGDIDLRLMFVMSLVVVAIVQLLITYLPYGRRLFAIGSNPDGARMVGLPMQRDVFLAYLGCGALAGLGGLMQMAKFGTITVDSARGLELAVIAAVVVGGANIFGGSGSAIGVLLGAVLISVLDQSLNRWIGISDFMRDALLGMLILVAVASDTILMGRLQTLWLRARRREEARAAPPPALTGGSDG
ncbi:MAG: ABC transporter permease [Chloroflexota bacterium]|nr:ABC transporter permease [Chloroflexota bacterium]